MRHFLTICLIGLLCGCTSMTAQRVALVQKIRGDLTDVPSLTSDPSFVRALHAIAATKREDFVSNGTKRNAYAERPQDIGFGQTISDPYIVAVMTAAANLAPHSHVLEVGTGSGYQAAVLSRLAARVYSIEILEPLAKAAAARLKRLRYDNVEVRAGDGFGGWPSAAPFDAIVVTAGADKVPAPLFRELAPGGRLVMPLGPSEVQERLMVFQKAADGRISKCVLGSAMFVPLTGRGERPKGLMGLEERGLAYCYGADVGRWDFEAVGAKRESKIDIQAR